MNINAPLIISGDKEYAYATGLVRGKWAKRLGRSEFQRLIETAPDEINKTLSELGFTGADKDPERALRDEWEQTISLVESVSRDPEITDLFRLFIDFTNAAMVLKSELFNFDPKLFYIDVGKTDLESLQKVASGEGHHKSVPPRVREAMLTAKALYKSIQIPLVIDVAADSYFLTVMANVLQNSKRIFLREFASRWLDSNNLTSYLRIRKSGISLEHFKRFFVDGGHLTRKYFREFENLELDSIPSRLVYSVYGKPLADAVTRLVRKDDFEPLSTYFKGMLESFLRQNIYISFGVEVVFAYAMLKKSELEAVGAIVRMKKALIDKETIHQRVRHDDL